MRAEGGGRAPRLCCTRPHLDLRKRGPRVNTSGLFLSRNISFRKCLLPLLLSLSIFWERFQVKVGCRSFPQKGTGGASAAKLPSVVTRRAVLAMESPVSCLTCISLDRNYAVCSVLYPPLLLLLRTLQFKKCPQADFRRPCAPWLLWLRWLGGVLCAEVAD